MLINKSVEVSDSKRMIEADSPVEGNNLHKARLLSVRKPIESLKLESCERNTKTSATNSIVEMVGYRRVKHINTDVYSLLAKHSLTTLKWNETSINLLNSGVSCE